MQFIGKVRQSVSYNPPLYNFIRRSQPLQFSQKKIVIDYTDLFRAPPIGQWGLSQPLTRLQLLFHESGRPDLQSNLGEINPLLGALSTRSYAEFGHYINNDSTLSFI